MILRIRQHSKLVRATFVLYMLTRRLLSYNCCKITIANFNLFVLSCTQFDETVQKENKSNQRRVKIHRILTFRKGQNSYTVTSCRDAKIYWFQLTSSSLRQLHVALRNLISVYRGVARIFQRGGHRGYSPDCHVDLHAHIN